MIVYGSNLRRYCRGDHWSSVRGMLVFALVFCESVQCPPIHATSLVYIQMIIYEQCKNFFLLGLLF